MAIVKPKISSGGNKFYGVCEATIIGYEDKSAKFDWADVFIEVEVRLKDSEFTKKMQICGELERTGEEVTGGSVLNRMYKFFDAIDCKAGINLKGDFEDEDGTLILWKGIIHSLVSHMATDKIRSLGLKAMLKWKEPKRNSPCFCESGKKYKKCCWIKMRITK